MFAFHPSFRVEAQARRLADTSPTAVRVRFLSESEVSLSRIGTKPGVEWPEDDAATLKASGVKAIFTPKDVDMNAIMGTMVDVIRQSNGLA